MSSASASTELPLPESTKSPLSTGNTVLCDGEKKLSKQKSAETEIIGQLPSSKDLKKHQPEDGKVSASACDIMVKESNFGAMPNFSGGRSEDNPSSSPLSSYLILSPSSPIRIFAISYLTHWIYSSVILIAICAFIISSVYCNYYKNSEIVGEVSVLQQFTRWILLVIILSEIVIKSVARGLLVQKFAYLRISWDWLDILSVLLIFVSIITPWQAMEFLAAAVVILKVIPIYPGSINAFIFLCSCAKKLIPILLYGIIIVWIYGVVIFTLFVKYSVHDEGEINNSSKSQGSMSDSKNGNITQISSVDTSVENSFTEGKAQNTSFGLSVECLPTDSRSLGGSFKDAIRMLSLQFGTTFLSPNRTAEEIPCQLETNTLSIVETLAVISGTLPILSMGFAILCHIFQKSEKKFNEKQQTDVEPEEDGESYSRHYPRRTTACSLTRSYSHSQNQQNQQEVTNSCYKSLSYLLCDWDYYFCCLASLQRKISPLSSRILNSKLFKYLILTIVILDFLCTIVLLWFSKLDSEFSFNWIVLIYIQVCFILYTIEAIFRWLSVSSDEYWKTCWPAFDLILVIIYWIGFTVILAQFNYHSYYLKFCGILMIRMLKVVPYWESLNHTLKLIKFCVLDNLHNLCVILICSFSGTFIKFTIFALVSWKAVQIFTIQLQTQLSLEIFMVVESAYLMFILFLCSVTVITIYMKTCEAMKTSCNDLPPVNPPISLLLSHNHLDHLHVDEPPRNNSSSHYEVSISNGISPQSTNGLLSIETRSFLSPSSDVLSPLLSVPSPNGMNINGHARTHSEELILSDDRIPRTESCENRNNSVWLSACSSSKYSLDDILNMASATVIVFSSVNIVLASSGNSQRKLGWSWNSIVPVGSLWIELFFVICIAFHIVYRTRLKKFNRQTFLQVCSVFDLLVILAAVVELFGSGMTWVPTKSTPGIINGILESAKIVSTCRGLMILSRISWLELIGSRVCYELWKLSKYLAAFGYIWLIYAVSSLELQEMLSGRTIGDGHSDSFSNVSHVGMFSFQISSGTDIKPSTNTVTGDFWMHPFLYTVTLTLFLLNIGIVLGLLQHHLKDLNQIVERFMTPGQVSYHRSRSLSHSHLGLSDTEIVVSRKPTEGTCVPMMFFVANHPIFDIVVMTVIFFDAIGITFESFADSERALILRKHYPAYMLFLYTTEVLSKIIGNGKFFHSYWNVFDCAIIIICVSGYFLSLIYQTWVLLVIQNIRFLRILRIFQFRPFIGQAQIISHFHSSICRIIPIIWNHATFYLGLYLAALVFRLSCNHVAVLCVKSLPEYFKESPPNLIALWVAAPFEAISLESIFEFFANPMSNLRLQCSIYAVCLAIYSLIRITVLVSFCYIIVATLYQDLTDKDQAIYNDVRSQEMYLEDKSSYLMPCISPDTIDLAETSSSAGTSSRVNNISRCMELDQNVSLYEDSNGCKVFYVEAMITTV